MPLHHAAGSGEDDQIIILPDDQIIILPDEPRWQGHSNTYQNEIELFPDVNCISLNDLYEEYKKAERKRWEDIRDKRFTIFGTLKKIIMTQEPEFIASAINLDVKPREFYLIDPTFNNQDDQLRITVFYHSTKNPLLNQSPFYIHNREIVKLTNIRFKECFDLKNPEQKTLHLIVEDLVDVKKITPFQIDYNNLTKLKIRIEFGESVSIEDEVLIIRLMEEWQAEQILELNFSSIPIPQVLPGQSYCSEYIHNGIAMCVMAVQNMEKSACIWAFDGTPPSFPLLRLFNPKFAEKTKRFKNPKINTFHKINLHHGFDVNLIREMQSGNRLVNINVWGVIDSKRIVGTNQVVNKLAGEFYNEIKKLSLLQQDDFVVIFNSEIRSTHDGFVFIVPQNQYYGRVIRRVARISILGRKIKERIDERIRIYNGHSV